MRFPPRFARLSLGFTLAAGLAFPFPTPAASARPAREVTARVTASSGSVTVPMDNRNGTLYVDATVNGKPARFIVDTGANVNVLTPDAAKKFDVALDDSRGTVTGAATIAARRGVLERLGVGTSGSEAVLERETVIVVPLPPEMRCDGLLGSTFLSRWVVTVDYVSGRLTLTDPKRFRKPDGVLGLPLYFSRGIPAVEARVNDLPGLFRIDTGANDAVTLFAPWVERNKLRDLLPRRIKTITGQGLGGYTYGELVRLPSLTVGGVTIKNVIGEFSTSDDTSAFHDPKAAGNIGAGIWRRFTLTIDYPGKRVYLVKSDDFDVPFLPNRSGLSLGFQGGLMQVIDVVAGSPASEVGIKTGDTIVALDGVGLNRLEPNAARAQLRAEPGTVVALLLRSPNGETRTVKITLRDLL